MESKEVQAIAEAVGKAVVTAMNQPQVEKPEPVVPDDNEGAYFDEQSMKVVYTDESVKAADEATNECLRTLPKGVVAYKGRTGTQVVNHSQESLDAIDSWKQKRRQYRTRMNVR